PVYVIFGDRSYKDYSEMSVAEFYARLAEVKAKGGEMPKTSQPSPNDFVQAYSALIREGAKHIISIHVTAKSSGTVNSANLAKDLVSGAAIHVIDSGSTSMLIGYMIEEASKAGDNIDEALAAVDRVKANSSLYFTVTELEHLEASGRTLGHEQVASAEIKIKPVIGVLDGVPKVVSPERTQKAAIDKVIELTKTAMLGKKIKGVTVVHGNAIDRAEPLKARVPSELGFGGKVYVTDFGPALGVHFGQGLLGLAVYGE
ncbi:MAG: DegV family protein, partial [Chloroflexi bacterium]|nr:DegV family protein [Chloroflexota bacterium]